MVSDSNIKSMDYLKNIKVEDTITKILDLPGVYNLTIPIPLGIMIMKPSIIFGSLNNKEKALPDNNSVIFGEWSGLANVLETGINFDLFYSTSNLSFYPVRIVFKRTKNDVSLKLEQYIPFNLSEEVKQDVGNYILRTTKKGTFISKPISSFDIKTVLQLTRTLIDTSKRITINHTTQDKLLGYIKI